MEQIIGVVVAVLTFSQSRLASNTATADATGPAVRDSTAKTALR